MAPSITSGDPPNEGVVRDEIAAILASDAFRRSSTLSRFLAFVCDEALAGRGERIKEYTIAVEALGRPATFQPKEDPVVRVGATRLRKALREFYRAQGRERRVRIVLPKGGYVPEFHSVEPAGGRATADRAPGAVASLEDSTLPPSRARIVLGGLAGSAVVALAVALWTANTPPHAAANAGALEPAPRALLPGTAEETGTTIRILAGSKASRIVDRFGRAWSGDRFFSGGNVEDTVIEPPSRTEDRDLWRHYRIGDDFEYQVPLPPGVYELRLYFAEPVFGADEGHAEGETARLFDVSANGRPLLKGFDIVGDAGGARTADVKVFTGLSPGDDGLLHLRFTGSVRSALVNALEIVPGLPDAMRPVRIATRETTFVSRDQRVWEADHYFTGGWLHPLRFPVAGSEDPELYATERFGNFSYTIPVADGRYTVVLHFNEGFFGLPGDGRGGGEGSRVFDIHCNGAVLEKGLDIFKEAGGAARTLRKEYHGLRASPLGKLVLTFQPDHNYPSLNALEVLAEGH